MSNLPGLTIIEQLISALNCRFETERRFTAGAPIRISKFGKSPSETIASYILEGFTPVSLCKWASCNEALLRHLNCSMESVGQILELSHVALNAEAEPMRAKVAIVFLEYIFSFF